MRRLSDGEDSKYETKDDGKGTGVVHFNVAWGRFLRSRVWD